MVTLSNAYALFYLWERCQIVIGHIRTTTTNEKLILAPPRQVSLECALEFTGDEIVKLTPAGQGAPGCEN